MVKEILSSKVIFAIFFSLLVAGCTTVDTFKKMTPDQRATAVCKRQNNIKAALETKQALEYRIADSNSALARGYRVHQQCQQVKVYGQATVNCSTSNGYTNCTEFRPESYETRCTETPVSLNFDLEKSNVDQWGRALVEVNSKLNSDWRRCYEYIYPMAPEQAFEHYK